MPIHLYLDELLPVLAVGVGVALGDVRTGALAGLLAYFLAKSTTSLRRSM
ncbi:MAG: hypothetical protein ABEJ78_00990 [Haloferacaceae archaeon]